jgi:Mrp family chromosome partitioning ATPase
MGEKNNGKNCNGASVSWPRFFLEFILKKLAVLALKGGVGKSTVVARLSLDLVGKGFTVGCVDLDVTGSNLYSALGLEHSPRWGLDSVNEKIIVPEVNGYWLLSIASFAGEENAVMWDGSQNSELMGTMKKIGELQHKLECEPVVMFDELEAIRKQIDDVVASSKWRYVTELLSADIVTWPKPLDYQIFDLPPSSSQEMFSFLDQTKDLFGVFIVSQPSAIATTGLVRTIDLLRVKQIPIVGLVVNQDGFLNSHGEIEYQFLSPRVGLEAIAKKAGIPFLLSIPQSGNVKRLEPYFSELADKIIKSTPVVLKDVTLGKKLKRRLAKGIARRL